VEDSAKPDSFLQDTSVDTAVDSVVEKPAVPEERDSSAVVPTSPNPGGTVDKLCLLIQMPDKKIRYLSQHRNVPECRKIYLTFPESLRGGVAHKSEKFNTILLKDWKTGWKAGVDTSKRTLQLY
jgi:hypothetical protein